MYTPAPSVRVGFHALGPHCAPLPMRTVSELTQESTLKIHLTPCPVACRQPPQPPVFRQPAQASTPAERKNSPSVETWPRLSMGVNQAGGGSWVIYPDLPTVLVKTLIPYIHPDMSSPCRIPPPLIPITKKNGPEDSNPSAVCRGPTAVCAVGPSECAAEAPRVGRMFRHATPKKPDETNESGSTPSGARPTRAEPGGSRGPPAARKEFGWASPKQVE